MHILLINANPVVSRLLVLCTRDEVVILEEVSMIDDVQSTTYDIVFVDEASYGREVAELLVKFSDAQKVFISYRSDMMKGFDTTIKKPFLPSQITDIIESVKRIEEDTPQYEEEMEVLDKKGLLNTPNILDGRELERIKALLEMDDDIEPIDEILSDDALEARKVEVIKEQLLSDGLEIVEEEKIIDELVDDLHLELDGTFTTKKKKKENDTTSVWSEDEIEDAVEMVIKSMSKKQIKKLLKGKKVDLTIQLEGKS